LKVQKKEILDKGKVCIPFSSSTFYSHDVTFSAVCRYVSALNH